MKKLRILLALAFGVMVLGSGSRQALAVGESLSLALNTAPVGGTSTVSMGIGHVADIESYSLVLSFASGNILSKSTAANWFRRQAYLPSSILATTTTDLNSVKVSSTPGRIYISGFKPTGSLGYIGDADLIVNTATTGDTQVITLSGQYFSKSQQKLVNFIPVSETFTVAAKPACSYFLLPEVLIVGFQAGGDSMKINTDAACSWTVTNNAPSWLTVTSATSGTGNGTVSFDYGKNTTGLDRSGTFTVSGNTFTVSQTPILPSIALRSNVFYNTIQSAYDEALTGDSIYVRDTGTAENLLFDIANTVFLDGGYDSNYSSTTGYSTISGTLKIQAGKVVPDKIKIKP